MEEGKFDDNIRIKLKEYSAPGFDPEALSALRHKMAAKDSVSWYQKYRLETLAGIMTLVLSLVILGSQWYWKANPNLQLEKENAALKNQLSALNQLQGELKKLQTEKEGIYLPNNLESEHAANLSTVPAKQKTPHSSPANTSFLSSPDVNQLPPLVLTILKQEGYVTEKDGSLFLSLPKDSTQSTWNIPSVAPEEIRYQLHLVFQKEDEDKKRIKEEKVSISAKLARDLEHHYGRGIGIRMCPSVEGLSQRNQLEEEAGFVAFGILTDFIMALQWSLETGLLYSERAVEVQGREVFEQLILPHRNEHAGLLKEVEIDSKVLSIPLNLKYHYPLTATMDLIGGFGVSGFLYTQQDFEYSYQRTDEGGSSFNVVEDHEGHGWHFYPGTLNLLVGASKQLPNHKIIEASLLYQHGIGPTGVEQSHSNYFGLRAAYWFTIR